MNLKIDISKRIAIGYFFILLIASIASVVSILRLQSNTSKYKEISSVYLPSISNLKEFEALSKESNRLIEGWIYISNKEEKERLRTIQLQEYPDLKFRMSQFSGTAENSDLQKEQIALLNQFDAIVAYQKKIMNNLSTPQQYASDSLVDNAIGILNNEIAPRYTANQQYLNNILAKESAFLKQVEADLDRSYYYLSVTMISMLVLIILIGTIASYLGTRSITKPIKNLKNIISELSKGEIPKITPTPRKDEIGEMTNAIAAMSESINVKAEFARKTGEGSYSTDFTMLSKNDILGLALVQMRNNLRRNAEEDAGRNWLNIGLAKVSDVLRLSEDGLTQMNKAIITFLAEYVGACGGAFFTVNDQSPNDIYLELSAGYAFEVDLINRKKISFGSGITGQAAIEKKTLIVNEVPEGFMKISSAFGDVTPKSIIIVPLVFENEVKGLIEFAGTSRFTDLQKEFLEKTAQSIAITLDVLSRKEKTETLLNESRELNEKLKLNEVELKSANEELSTFVYRASHDLRGPLSTIIGLVNASVYEKLDTKGTSYMEMVGDCANKLDKVLIVLIKTMAIKDESLNIDKVDFNGMLKPMLDNLKMQNESKRTKFFTNIEIHEPFYTDSEILSYALFNIIENAIKFQNNSLPESYVLIGIKKHGEGLKIDISDNGIGVKKEVQSKVFDMFFRGSAQGNGIGLGLYLVKKAITKLKGKVEFNSDPGNGTFVSIYLPNLIESQIEKEVEIPKLAYR